MKSKIDWKNKKLLLDTANNASSYADMLRSLGLSNVSSNVTTLKKHIKNHNIDVTRFGLNNVQPPDPVTIIPSPQSESSTIVNTQQIPSFTLTASVRNQKEGIKIELEWNDDYVDFLKKNSYYGTNPDDIINDWLFHLLTQLAEYRQQRGDFTG